MLQNSFFRFFPRSLGGKVTKHRSRRLLNNLIQNMPFLCLSRAVWTRNKNDDDEPFNSEFCFSNLNNRRDSSESMGRLSWISISLTLSHRGTMLKEQAFRLMQIGSSHRSEKEPSILGDLNKLATQTERQTRERKTFDCSELHAKFVAAAVAYELSWLLFPLLSSFHSFDIARMSSCEQRLRRTAELFSFRSTLMRIFCFCRTIMMIHCWVLRRMRCFCKGFFKVFYRRFS